MPDSQPADKNSLSASAASNTSFNKTLSALTGSKNLGATGAGGGGGGGGGASGGLSVPAGGGLSLGAPSGTAGLALGAFGAKLTVPCGGNGTAPPTTATPPPTAKLPPTAKPPSSLAPPAPGGGGGGGLAGLFGGGGGGKSGGGGLLGVTSALKEQQQQQQPPATSAPSAAAAAATTANNVNSNDVAASEANLSTPAPSPANPAVPAAPTAPATTNSTPAPPVHQTSIAHLRMSASGAPAATADDVITVTETLIDAIGRGDYDTWKRMTSHDLTAFEPESQGCLVEGREFHKYYFDLGVNEKTKPTLRVNLIAPRVHLLGPDAGVIGYVLLTQFVDAKSGLPQSRQCEESRVWRRDRDGLWRCVHIHRSTYDHNANTNNNNNNNPTLMSMTHYVNS